VVVHYQAENAYDHFPNIAEHNVDNRLYPLNIANDLNHSASLACSDQYLEKNNVIANNRYNG
jgi:hypothetical protein